MPFFEITYEDMGFTRDDTEDCVLSEDFMIGFSEAKRAQQTFPEHVVALKEAYITEDDHQGEDKKVFLPITFVVQAETEEHALKLGIPAELLSEVADLVIAEPHTEVSVDFDGSWQHLSTYESDFALPVAAKPSTRAGVRP